MENGKESLFPYINKFINKIYIHYISIKISEWWLDALMFYVEHKFFTTDFCIGTSKLIAVIYCTEIIYKSLCRIKIPSFNFIVWINTNKQGLPKMGQDQFPSEYLFIAFAWCFQQRRSNFQLNEWVQSLMSYN